MNNIKYRYMKILICAFSLVLVSFVALGQKGGNLQDVTLDTRDVPAFNAIEITDGIQLFLTQSHVQKVEVSASQAAYMNKIKTVVEEGKLRIYFDSSDDPNWKGLVNSREVFKVYVSVVNLVQLAASNGASVHMEQAIQGHDPMTLLLASGAQLTGSIAMKAIHIGLKSGATAKISGQADTLEISAVEGTAFKSPGLNVKECKAFAASGSTIVVKVEEKMRAKALNQAVIKYKGQGILLEKSTESGGRIIRN